MASTLVTARPVSQPSEVDASGPRAELDPIVARTRLIASRIWQLRGNLTTYDAAYVAAGSPGLGLRGRGPCSPSACDGR
jgi:hypothetical protein